MYIYPENRKLYSLYRATREIAFQNIYKIIFENKFVNYCVSGKKLFVISEEEMFTLVKFNKNTSIRKP